MEWRRCTTWVWAHRLVLFVLAVGLLAGLPAPDRGHQTVQARMAVQDEAAAEETLCGYPVVPLDSVLDPSFGEGGEVALDPVRLGVTWEFLAVDHQDRWAPSSYGFIVGRSSMPG